MAKVLHINCSSTGSTGKIIGDIADYTANKGYENLLCAPSAPGTNPNVRYFRTSLPKEQGVYARLNRFYCLQYSIAPLSTVRIKRIIKREKPDLIHIHCINCYMVNVHSLLAYIKKLQIPMVFTNHAEFYYTGNCPWAFDCDKWMTGCGNCPRVPLATGGKLRDTTAAGWKKMQATFSNMENTVMVSVSPWVGQRADRSPVVRNIPKTVIKNGVNTDMFTYRDAAALREKYNISPETKIIVHTTANFSNSPKDRKGGRYLLELAKRFLGQDVLFVVAGKYTLGLEVPENMKLLGLVSDQKVLAEYYAMADITVVTGERETFNMPVAESLCCGTPVAGFFAGGPESIAIARYSRFVEHANVDALQAQVCALLEQNFSKEEIAAEAKKVYAAEVMAKEYMDIYNSLLKDR